MKRANPKIILIINVHSTKNSGDAALLWLNTRQLLNAFAGVSFRALVNYPNEPFYSGDSNFTAVPSPFALLGTGLTQSDWKKIIKFLYGCLLILVGSILPKDILRKSHSDWFRIVLTYRSADVVAAVSGAQMVSLGKYSWPLIVSSLPVFLTHYFRKPLYIMPQSIGPFRWRWEKILVRSIYSRARLILVRDKISLRLLNEIGLPENKIKFASDPGFSLPAAPRKLAIEIMTEFGYILDQKAVGITIIGQLSKGFRSDRIDSYYLTLAETLAKFAQEFDTKIYIFDQVTGPTSKEDDSLASEKLLDILNEKQNRIIHVNRYLNPMELKACYGLMDMFVASRLHSGIFAMSSGVSTIFIGYNPKTRGVLEAAGLDHQVVDLNNLDKNQLWNLLCQTWQNRKKIADNTRSAVMNCQKDYDLVSQWIAKDYFDACKS